MCYNLLLHCFVVRPIFSSKIIRLFVDSTWFIPVILLYSSSSQPSRLSLTRLSTLNDRSRSMSMHPSCRLDSMPQAQMQVHAQQQARWRQMRPTGHARRARYTQIADASKQEFDTVGAALKKRAKRRYLMFFQVKHVFLFTNNPVRHLFQHGTI